MNIKIILENLINKLEEMKPHLDNVCHVSAVHGFPYRGPTWEKEVKEAKEVLAENNKFIPYHCKRSTKNVKDIDLYDVKQLELNFEPPIKDETEL